VGHLRSDYEQYWDGFRLLFAATDVIAIGEPLVRAMAGLPPRSGGCGVATVRVTPRATVQPCVYWPGLGAPLSDLTTAGLEVLNSPSLSRPARCPKPVALASSSNPAAEDVPDGAASRRATRARFLPARLSAATVRHSQSAWPPTAICRN
jgi:hypothetical protein